MKYLVLLYDNPNVRETLTAAALADMRTLLSELTEAGELLGTEALADPSQTKTLRGKDGDGLPVVSDGPFAEAKEFLGGFLLLDVENQQRALDIMARWPEGLCAAIEVRPLMHQGGPDSL